MPGSRYIPVVQPLPAVDSPLRGLPSSRTRHSSTVMTSAIKTALVIATLALAAGSGTASAQNTFIAPGARPCVKWSEHREVRDLVALGLRTADESWLAGFLAGLAAGTGFDVMRNTDQNTVIAWMTNYCRENVLSNTATGGQILFNELQRRDGRLR